MRFSATLHPLPQHGAPPSSFLTEVVTWGRSADLAIVAANVEPDDILPLLRNVLGQWDGVPQSRLWLQSRLAAIMECMRVHAARESEWNWNEGVDTTNATSVRDKNGQESGIFQVSFNSEWLAHHAMAPYARAHDIDTVDKFIPRMKSDHQLALGFYARLIRVNHHWAGPLISGVVLEQLHRPAHAEFLRLLQ